MPGNVMQDAVEPFTAEVRANFDRFIRRPEHTNRARMSAEKRCLMQLFLRISTLKPTNKYEIDLRTQLHGYRLDADPMCHTRGGQSILTLK